MVGRKKRNKTKPFDLELLWPELPLAVTPSCLAVKTPLLTLTSSKEQKKNWLETELNNLIRQWTESFTRSDGAFLAKLNFDTKKYYSTVELKPLPSLPFGGAWSPS